MAIVNKLRQKQCIFDVESNLRDLKIVAVVDRWSLFTCNLCDESSEWDHKMMVAVEKCEENI